MKIAVGIIGIFLGLLVLMQSCAVTAGSGLLQDKATGGAGAIGMLVGLLFFIAGAFSFALPLVGTIMSRWLPPSLSSPQCPAASPISRSGALSRWSWR